MRRRQWQYAWMRNPGKLGDLQEAMEEDAIFLKKGTGVQIPQGQKGIREPYARGRDEGVFSFRGWETKSNAKFVHIDGSQMSQVL